METYYYETHASNGPFKVQADTDDGALALLRIKYGEHLQGIMIVYMEDGPGNIRTVWME